VDLEALFGPSRLGAPAGVWKLMNFQQLVKFKEGTYFLGPLFFLRTVGP